MKKQLFILLFPAMFFLSCKKENESSPNLFPEIEAGQMVLVCAEGNFRWANSEAGLMNLRTGKSEWKVFQKMNGRPLGDVLQSAFFWNNKLWLVVNNSGRLEGVNPATFKVEESISGLRSPRFIQSVSAEKAYVSDLYDNAIRILTKGNSKPSGSIPMPGWTEEMLKTGNHIWVLCRDQPYLLGINLQTDTPDDTIFLPGKGRSLCSGPSGKIWVSYEGGSGNAPGIRLVNPANKQTELFWSDENRESVPDRLVSSAAGDTLFFLYNGLCRFSRDGFYPYPLGTGNWYGLGMDIVRRELWISDVKDYQQASRIIRLDVMGNKIQEYEGGIISSRFVFW